MTEVNIPPSSFFLCHGHVHHTGAALNWRHYFWYHTNVICKDANPKDAIRLSYGDSLNCVTNPHDASDSDEVGSSPNDSTKTETYISGSKEQNLDDGGWGRAEGIPKNSEIMNSTFLCSYYFYIKMVIEHV